jgi:hypothetical protein
LLKSQLLTFKKVDRTLFWLTGVKIYSKHPVSDLEVTLAIGIAAVGRSTVMSRPRPTLLASERATRSPPQRSTPLEAIRSTSL